MAICKQNINLNQNVMKKITLLLIGILIISFTNAQQLADTNYVSTSIGNELISVSKHFSYSTEFSLIAIAFTTTGCLLEDKYAQNACFIAGGVCGIVSLINYILIPKHIKLAGQIMNLQAGKDGLGLSIKIKKN